MGYVENNLLSGETVIYRANTHWKIFIKPAMFLLLGLYLYLNGWSIPVYLFVGLGIFYLIPSLLKYFTDEFAVTNQRVILKQGFFSTESLEIPLNQIAAVGVSEPILGRILGYGTIKYGSGAGVQEFKDISAPKEFRKKATQQALNP